MFEILPEVAQPAIGIPLHIHCLTREPNLISLPSVALDLGKGFVGDDSQDLLGDAAGLGKPSLR